MLDDKVLVITLEEFVRRSKELSVEKKAV